MLSECLEGLLEVAFFPMEYSELVTNGIPASISQHYNLLGIIGTDDPLIPEAEFVYLETIISGGNAQKCQRSLALIWMKMA